MKYVKELEAYRLGDEEIPDWVQQAIDQNIIYFVREDMFDAETNTLHKNAITGIANSRGTYPIDSYIVYEDDSVNIVKPDVFNSRNLKKVEEK